jgi:hypothetical protein
LLIGTGEYARDGSAAKQPTDDPAVFLRGVVSRIADNGYGASWEQPHTPRHEERR